MGKKTTQKGKTWDGLVLQVIQIRVMARIAQLEKLHEQDKIPDIMSEAIKEETTRVSRQMRETLESMIDREGQLDEGYCKRSNDRLLERMERKRGRAKAKRQAG